MNIYTGTYNGQIYMFSGHPTNLSFKRKNQISQTSIRALYLPINSQQLLCGGFQSQLISVDKNTLHSLKQTKQPKAIINCITKINQHVVAVGHDNGLIRFWDWKNWNLKKQQRQHKKSIRSFSLNSNEILFFSVAGKSLILWDTSKYQTLFHYKFDYEIEHVLINETTEYIILVNQKQIHQIQANDNKQVAACQIEGAQMIQKVLLYNNFLVAGGDKGNIFIYNLGSFKNKIKYKAHQLRVKCMKIQSYEQSDYLITGSSNGQICVWDILQFLKEVENIGQDYELTGLKPLSTVNIEQRIICLQTGLIHEVNNPLNNQKNAQNNNKRKVTQDERIQPFRNKIQAAQQEISLSIEKKKSLKKQNIQSLKEKEKDKSKAKKIKKFKKMQPQKERQKHPLFD